MRTLRVSDPPWEVVMATYRRDGDVRTGSFAFDHPSPMKSPAAPNWAPEKEHRS